MKKLIMIIALFAFMIVGATAQNTQTLIAYNSVSTAKTYDTITNSASGCVAIQIPINSLWKYCFQVYSDKQSGSPSSTCKLEGSVDNTYWSTISQSTDTLTDDGYWGFTDAVGTPYLYFRATITQTGTAVTWVYAKMVIKK